MTTFNPTIECSIALAIAMHGYYGISAFMSVILALAIGVIVHANALRTLTVLTVVHAVCDWAMGDLEVLCVGSMMLALLARYRCEPVELPFAARIAWYGCVNALLMRA
jgi:hypothetical protein